MKIGKQSATGVNGLARWAGGLCALMLVFGVAVKSHAIGPPVIIFSEDFEEATLGGVYNYSPVTDTTGISPTIGTWSPSKNDTGEIVAGLNGSTKALSYYDTRAGFALRTDAITTLKPTEERVVFSMDFKATGPFSGGPFQLLLRTDTGANLMGLLLFSDMSLLATASTNALFAGGFGAGGLGTGTEYRLRTELNLDTYKYDLLITSNSTPVVSATGLDFLNTTDLKTVGFGSVALQGGFADFGGSPAAFTVDNIMVVAIPEPTILSLMIAGPLVLWWARRRQT